ncbi:uncharacterized protein LOC115297530 [Suricata suricatta]|uniref:uncharacterized protein LOC115297530 n=1 Tax=Suricata suricatta TaxID=37032 RepID=UPI0011557B5E|nr:uncharacterized protein LOC115297530 [Suricata suricatta]
MVKDVPECQASVTVRIVTSCKELGNLEAKADFRRAPRKGNHRPSSRRGLPTIKFCAINFTQDADSQHAIWQEKGQCNCREGLVGLQILSLLLDARPTGHLLGGTSKQATEQQENLPRSRENVSSLLLPFRGDSSASSCGLRVSIWPGQCGPDFTRVPLMSQQLLLPLPRCPCPPAPAPPRRPQQSARQAEPLIPPAAGNRVGAGSEALPLQRSCWDRASTVMGGTWSSRTGQPLLTPHLGTWQWLCKHKA